MLKVKHVMSVWLALVVVVFLAIAIVTPIALMFLDGVPAFRDIGNYLMIQVLAFPIALLITLALGLLTLPVAVLLCASDLPPDASEDGAVLDGQPDAGGRVSAWLVVLVALLAAGAMAVDHRFFANPAGYGQIEAPSYWAHGALFAAYLALIGLRTTAARWKTVALAIGGATFFLWSGPVVSLALSMHEREGAIGGVYRAIDSWNGADASGALLTGLAASGLLMAGVLGWYAKSVKVAAWVLGATAFAGVFAVGGWSRASGETASLLMLYASGIVWHAGVCAGLVRWANARNGARG